MAKSYKIQIDEDALKDILEACDWYNKQISGLGHRFQKQVKKQINSLKSNPNKYAIRYSDVRCVLIKKFPFLVHYTVDESQNMVEVFAVFHTSRSPMIWDKRNT